MPDLSHLWQRFLVTAALLVGFAFGVGSAVFGASNTTKVDVHWWFVSFHDVSLWKVAVVPVAVTLAAGYVFHIANGFHHFTEHMRHRRRVHELEAEVKSLRAHLDQVLEMPDERGPVSKRGRDRALPETDGITDLGPVEKGDLSDLAPPTEAEPRQLVAAKPARRPRKPTVRKRRRSARKAAVRRPRTTAPAAASEGEGPGPFIGGDGEESEFVGDIANPPVPLPAREG